jgi:hypothetical protein
MRFVSILALSVLPWAAVQAPAMAQTWQVYSYPEQGFAIQLPTPPSVETGVAAAPTGGLAPVRTYSAKGAGIDYSLTIFDLSKTGVGEQDAIAQAEKAIGATGVVAVSVNARINREFGRELTVKANDGSRLTVAIFFRDKHLYQLVAKAEPPDAVAHSAEALHFQQSLEFTGQPGPDEPGGQGGPGGPGGPGGRRGGRFRGPGGRGGPNPQAVAACAGKAPGAVVQLDTPDGAVPATCILVARPNRPPPGGPPPDDGPPPDE